MVLVGTKGRANRYPRCTRPPSRVGIVTALEGAHENRRAVGKSTNSTRDTKSTRDTCHTVSRVDLCRECSERVGSRQRAGGRCEGADLLIGAPVVQRQGADLLISVPVVQRQSADLLIGVPVVQCQGADLLIGVPVDRHLCARPSIGRRTAIRTGRSAQARAYSARRWCRAASRLASLAVEARPRPQPRALTVSTAGRPAMPQSRPSREGCRSTTTVCLSRRPSTTALRHRSRSTNSSTGSTIHGSASAIARIWSGRQ